MTDKIVGKKLDRIIELLEEAQRSSGFVKFPEVAVVNSAPSPLLQVRRDATPRPKEKTMQTPDDIVEEPPCGSQVTDCEGDVWEGREDGWALWLPGRAGWFADLYGGGLDRWLVVRVSAPLRPTTDADRERVGMPVEPAPADDLPGEPACVCGSVDDFHSPACYEPADITEEPPVGSRLTDCQWHVWRRGERGWGIEGLIPGSDFDNPWSTVRLYAPLTALEPAPADDITETSPAEDVPAPSDAGESAGGGEAAVPCPASPCPSCAPLRGQIESLEADLARMTRGRDEARRERDDAETECYAETQALGSASAHALALAKERDEAREDRALWEQQTDKARAERDALKAKADRYDALRADVEEEHAAADEWSLFSWSEAKLARILNRDDRRAES